MEGERDDAREDPLAAAADGLTCFPSEKVLLSTSPNLHSSALEEIGRHNTSPAEERLHTGWTFWFERSPRRESPEGFAQRKLCEARTIKAFWGVVNNITPVEQLEERSGYHLMREGVVPTWEGNVRGGYWSMMCPKTRTRDVWIEILLAAVGEQLSEAVDEGDDVVGVSVRIRDREDMIQVWNKDSNLVQKANVSSKLHELCKDLEFKDKYVACGDKMHQNPPLPPKVYPHGPFPPPPRGPHGPFPPPPRGPHGPFPPPPRGPHGTFPHFSRHRPPPGMGPPPPNFFDPPPHPPHFRPPSHTHHWPSAPRR